MHLQKDVNMGKKYAELLRIAMGVSETYNRRITDKFSKNYETVLNGITDGLYEWDYVTGVVNVSRRFCAIFGLDKQRLEDIDCFLNDIILPEDLVRCRNIINELKTDKSAEEFSFGFRIAHAAQGIKGIINSGSIIRDENGNITRFIGSVKEDASASRRVLGEGYFSSEELVGLPQKQHVFDTMRNNIKSNPDTVQAVLVLDLDNFKNINDTLDHFAGDEVIRQIGDVLAGYSGKDGAAAARLNTDEFVVYLPDAKSADSAKRFALELLQDIKKPINIGNTSICVSASIGISVFPQHALHEKTLLRYADIAMQSAKQAGKDSAVVFDADMYEKILRRENVARTIREGLDKSEFEVHYQPQYSAITGEITGFEALLRLNSSRLGSISPSEFIPIAEETGYITELGRWVFLEACNTVSEFKKKGYRFGKMAINISLIQLKQPGFADEVLETLKKLDISTNDIELELTETQLLEYMSDADAVMRSMEQLGINLALDDFGSGYSSLNQLRRLWINTLKIDKKFVDNVDVDSKDFEIVKLVVNLAHCLDLCVVAEGVETKSQLDILLSLGCDRVQGFYYSRAVPKDVAELMLKEQCSTMLS